MPQGRPTVRHESGSVAEQMMGRGDEKRSTKTFIEDGPLATMLGAIQGMPRTWINMGKQLHIQEFGGKLSDLDDEILFDLYPEARELLEIHQRVIEHKGSQLGFLVKGYTGSDRRESLEHTKEKDRSSGSSQSDNDKWNH